ncbi:NUDIX domain-containing protein [Streptomyces sp. NBC_00536]|uniref:NUDIX hydrolase n=1 Tax=Streptomyces sp. NBC_00536 TaxID=2975769 RepID=UPI002E8129E8|nr:NUDIX domain-containing protein [Streptomyces sp. NBC_00536]WUC79033.1 NUDIX domain-containing protein [Streptomyces sp. NBC_00536]
MKFIVLVGAIPVIDGHVLVLQRSMSEKFMPGAWGLPCGKIEFGEDLETAVLRELREESGITGTVRRIVGYSTFMSQKDGEEVHNVQVNFEVEAPDKEVVLDRSNQDFRWVRLDELSESKLDDFTVNTIKQVFRTEIPHGAFSHDGSTV